MLLLLWLWLNRLLLSCGERPSQHRQGKLGSLQLGSRGSAEGGGGGGAGAGGEALAADGGATFLVAAADVEVTRPTLGLGLVSLETAVAAF